MPPAELMRGLAPTQVFVECTHARHRREGLVFDVKVVGGNMKEQRFRIFIVEAEDLVTLDRLQGTNA